jgi:hypothetical protein
MREDLLRMSITAYRHPTAPARSSARSGSQRAASGKVPKPHPFARINAIAGEMRASAHPLGRFDAPVFLMA